MGNEPPKVEKPVKEQIREQKRNVEKSMRGIEREMKNLEREEKKILAEMKKMAKKGQDVSIPFIIIFRKQQSNWLKM
jgi:hypothetical protein